MTHRLPPMAAERTRRWLVITIVLAQAIWLFLLMRRGWYLQSELSNLSEAHRSGLTWAYLSSSIGGHFGPVGRLSYWLLAHTAPLNYTLTVVVRVGLQAVATYLLWRLIKLLVGDRPAAVVITGLYAASPLLVSGLAWLTSGIGLAPGQIFLLLSLHHLVLFAQDSRLRDAAICSVLTGLAVLTADLNIAALYLLPALALGFCYQGSLADRLRRLREQTAGWVIIAATLAAYLVYSLTATDVTASTRALSGADALGLVRDEWLKSVGPSIIGGPWRWFADSATYVGFEAPSQALVTAGQIALVVLVVLGIRIRGPVPTAIAWSMPVVTSAASVLLVGAGRFDTYGRLIPITPRYSFDIPIAIALALALSLTPVESVAPVAQRAAGSDEVSAADDDPLAPRDAPALPRGTLVIACVLILISSALSTLRFVDRLAQNPARGYTRNLIADGLVQGRNLNLFDTAVPESVVSGIEPNHHVSDLLDLARVPARYDVVSRPAQVVDSTGHIRVAGFLAAASGVGTTLPACGFYLSGAGRWRIELSTAVPRAEWFVRLSLYQKDPSIVDVSVEDVDGDVVAPIGGSRIPVPTTLAQVNRRLPLAAPDAVLISTDDPHASICLSEVAVGGPTVAGSS